MSQKKKPSTEPVTIRLHKSHVARLENEAAAAMMSRSAYIQSRLLGDEPQPCSRLAALAHLISIHAVIQRTGAIDAGQLDELRLLVLQLSRSAYDEGRAGA